MNCNKCLNKQKICSNCYAKKMQKTMPYFTKVLEEMLEKYEIDFKESLFNICEQMNDEDSHKFKMAFKYPKGRLRLVK